MTVMKLKRLDLGLSQAQLEQKSGIPHWKLSLAERGIPCLSKEELAKAAEVLGVKAEKLQTEVKL